MFQMKDQIVQELKKFIEHSDGFYKTPLGRNIYVKKLESNYRLVVVDVSTGNIVTWWEQTDDPHVSPEQLYTSGYYPEESIGGVTNVSMS